MSIGSAAFLVTGSEILDGRVVDTNSAYLAAELLELGIGVSEIVKISDEKGAISDRLKTLLSRYDLVMVSGGLGPTTDDVTRDGVAEALNVSLELYPEELKRLEEYFSSRGRKFFEQAKQQAYFPKGSSLLPNYAGSAAGFCVPAGTKLVTVTPGPPVELKSVWERSLKPLLVKKYGVKQLPTVFFRLFGIPESYVGQAVIEMKLPPSVDVSYRAVSPEVHLMFKAETLPPGIEADFLAKIDKHCVVNRDKNISAVDEVCQLLLARRQTVAIVELMPCGLASSFSSSKFARDVFGGATVSSFKGAKFGESSAIAAGAELLKDSKADFVLVVSEQSESSSGDGKFLVSLVSKTHPSASKSYCIAGDLPRVRRYATGAAVDFIRRMMLGVPVLEGI